MTDSPIHEGRPAVQKDALGAALRLGERLTRLGWVMGSAESCTGGLVAATLTDIPGASLWFDRGLVTYSNAAKQQHLGVSEQTLARWGAVSEETAGEMAAGLLAASPSLALAVSTTGVAGPGGGSPAKPVGTVCFGVAWREGAAVQVRTTIRHFPGNRVDVRWASVAFVLHWAAGQPLIER